MELDGLSDALSLLEGLKLADWLILELALELGDMLELGDCEADLPLEGLII